MAQEKAQPKDGIRINTKTILSITAILLVMWVLAGVLTRIVPRGEYTTFTDPDTGKTSITDRSEYAPLEDYTMPVWKIVAAPVMVFAEEETRDTGMTGILIIVFIVLMGGTFLLLERAGVLKYLVAVVIRRFSSKKYLLLSIIVLFFMFLASTAGILEESVTLVPIASAVSLALGWDSLMGLGMSLIPVAFGFTAATFNPFNVMTVQRLAGDVEIFSGLWLRLVTFVFVYAALMLFLVIYAKRIEKDPKKSVAYESDRALREKYSVTDMDGVLGNAACKKAALAFAVCLGMAFVCILLDFILGMGGTLSMGGIALFFVLGGISAAFIVGMRGKALFSGFAEGVKTVVPTLPLIVIVISIAYILNTGRIMHTILYHIYNLLQNVSPFGAVLMIFVFIALLEIFIGSGTAKAFLVMPLVIPLAHLLGVSSNTVALTFAMADGFTNLLYPTSGIMIIAIGIIGVSYPKWLKFSWKLFLVEGVVAVGIMLLAVAVNYH